MPMRACRRTWVWERSHQKPLAVEASCPTTRMTGMSQIGLGETQLSSWSDTMAMAASGPMKIISAKCLPRDSPERSRRRL